LALAAANPASEQSARPELLVGWEWPLAGATGTLPRARRREGNACADDGSV